VTVAGAVPRRAVLGEWSGACIWLGLVWAAMLWLFRRDLSDLTAIWWANTTYGHCLFIGPVVAWLVWQRRGELARLTPVAWAPGLAWIAAGAAFWWAGEVAAVALARQLGLVVMLQGAAVVLLGPNVARGLAFPMGYALFLVPFGDELEPPLQAVTVAIVMPLLKLFGVPASADGVVIHAGRYWFEVAEACSGSKFVLAMLAFGVLVAQQCFRSWRRRAVFLGVAMVVPVVANGVRAFGTIYAAHLTSVEAATGFDHIVFGWVFFAAVMAGVLAAGWRWFDRAPDAPAFDPAGLQAIPRWPLDRPVASVLAVLVPSLFVAWAAAGASAAAIPARIALPEVPGWRRVALSTQGPWQPWHPGADHRLFGRYRDASGAAVDMGVVLYAAQGEGRELVAFGTGVLREDDRWVRVADLPRVAGGKAMLIRAPRPDGSGAVERVVAWWYRVGDATPADPVAVKVETLKARLLGRPAPAMAVYLSSEGRDARGIARFAVAIGGVEAASTRIGAGAR